MTAVSTGASRMRAASSWPNASSEMAVATIARTIAWLPGRRPTWASFAVWRAAQVGLRPGSQAIVRAIVATAISLEALGQLEAARLLLAPVLTAIAGAGVYLLPTYAGQARAGRRLSPRVELAMVVVPESQTGALLLSGLVLLASRRRQSGRRLAGS